MEVCFIRDECFYLLELPDDDNIEAHVRRNPGTIRVERLTRQGEVEVLWPKPGAAPPPTPEGKTP